LNSSSSLGHFSFKANFSRVGSTSFIHFHSSIRLYPIKIYIVISDKPQLVDSNYTEWREHLRTFGADLQEVVGLKKDEIWAKGVKGGAVVMETKKMC